MGDSPVLGKGRKLAKQKEVEDKPKWKGPLLPTLQMKDDINKKERESKENAEVNRFYSNQLTSKTNFKKIKYDMIAQVPH